MRGPDRPENEAERLDTLQALNVLDTAPEERFDRITRLARRLLQVPITLVSLVDEERQWFKSRQGLQACETSRDISFCGHAILSDEPFLIADAREDERFHDNPLVTGPPHIRFYAGMPLRARNGARLGTLCAIDRQPRVMDPDDLQVLRDLAGMVQDELSALALATMDELTQLSNRRGFERLAKSALDVCRREARPAVLLYLDLDDFKAINDRFGHAEGDRALVEVARLLQESFRGSDVIARLGGDEFCVLLSCAHEQEVELPLARFADKLAARNSEPSRRYPLAYSAGWVRFDPSRHASVEALLGDADARMYRDKEGRRS